MRQNKKNPAKGIRIIRGSLGGRMIRFEERPDLRPTLGRVREAVFSILDPFRTSHGFVDLCAGSGAMGFEAYSAGFRPVLFMDADPVIIRSLQENATQLDAAVSVRHANAPKIGRILTTPGAYVIYGDPPYRDRSFHRKMVGLLAGVDAVTTGSLYIAEQESSFFPDPEVMGFSLFKQKNYGRVHLFFLIKK